MEDVIVESVVKEMSKYKAIRTEVNGIKFASKAEAARYNELQFLAYKGIIQNCSRQVKYPLLVNGQKIGAYIADFVYTENGKTVVEDVKGFPTPLYRWKKKHMLAQYGIEITEIKGWNGRSNRVKSSIRHDHLKPMIDSQ